MWFKREQGKNRRLHRHHVLDVKLRSDQVRANRVRLARISFVVVLRNFFWPVFAVADRRVGAEHVRL